MHYKLCFLGIRLSNYWGLQFTSCNRDWYRLLQARLWTLKTISNRELQNDPPCITSYVLLVSDYQNTEGWNLRVVIVIDIDYYRQDFELWKQYQIVNFKMIHHALQVMFTWLKKKCIQIIHTKGYMPTKAILKCYIISYYLNARIVFWSDEIVRRFWRLLFPYLTVNVFLFCFHSWETYHSWFR